MMGESPFRSKGDVVDRVGLDTIAKAFLLLALTSGCGNNGKREDDSDSATTDSSVDVDLPSDEPQPYQRCNEACVGQDLVDIGCSSCSNCGPDFEAYGICVTSCEDVTECGPAPQGGTVVCVQHSCNISCENEECPEGMQCIDFGHEDLVCMFP